MDIDLTDIIEDVLREEANDATRLLLDRYVAQLTATELRVLELAKQQLGTSFNLEQSNGFLKWCTTNN